MKKRMIATTIVWLWAVCVAQQSTEPPSYGVYYKAKGGWQQLNYIAPLNVSSGAFSGSTLSYHGAEALLQLSEHRPAFYVSRMPTAGSMVIVLFEKKKDHREVKVIRTHVLTAKGGPDQKHLPDITVQAVNDHVILITPSQDLPRGEYLLTPSGGYGGYDFGVN